MRAKPAAAIRISRLREPPKQRAKAPKPKKRVPRTQKKRNPVIKSKSREEPEWPKQPRERAPRDAKCARPFCRLPGSARDSCPRPKHSPRKCLPSSISRRFNTLLKNARFPALSTLLSLRAKGRTRSRITLTIHRRSSASSKKEEK